MNRPSRRPLGPVVVPITGVLRASTGGNRVGGGTGIVEHAQYGAAHPAAAHALLPPTHEAPAHQSAQERPRHDRRQERQKATRDVLHRFPLFVDPHGEAEKGPKWFSNICYIL